MQLVIAVVLFLAQLAPPAATAGVEWLADHVSSPAPRAHYLDSDWWTDKLARRAFQQLVDVSTARDRARLRCEMDPLVTCWLEPCRPNRQNRLDCVFRCFDEMVAGPSAFCGVWFVRRVVNLWILSEFICYVVSLKASTKGIMLFAMCCGICVRLPVFVQHQIVSIGGRALSISFFFISIQCLYKIVNPHFWEEKKIYEKLPPETQEEIDKILAKIKLKLKLIFLKVNFKFSLTNTHDQKINTQNINTNFYALTTFSINLLKRLFIMISSMSIKIIFLNTCLYKRTSLNLAV